jgi:hypothetical protein
MIVLDTTASQTLKFIPRDFLASFYTNVRDTSLNKTFSYFVTDATTSGDYLTFTNSYVDDASASIFKENRFYDLEIKVDYNYWNGNLMLWQNYNELWNVDGNIESPIYKDRIFCSSQDISQADFDYYDLNKDQYIFL